MMASKTVVALVVWSMFCGAMVQAQDFDFFYFVQQVGRLRVDVFCSGRVARIEQCVGVSFVCRHADAVLSSGQGRIATQDRAAAFHSPAALRRCLAFTAFGPTSTMALTLLPAAMSLTTPRRYPYAPPLFTLISHGGIIPSRQYQELFCPTSALLSLFAQPEPRFSCV